MVNEHEIEEYGAIKLPDDENLVLLFTVEAFCCILPIVNVPCLCFLGSFAFQSGGVSRFGCSIKTERKNV